MSTRKLRFYEFGPFRLDVRERLVLKDGEIVSLTPMVFETLLLLVQNSGHLLEREVLLGKLWPDSFVEEGSLAQNISLLRKALVDSDSTPYIYTFPKRGYLFTSNITEVYEEDNHISEASSTTPEAHISSSNSVEQPVQLSATTSHDNKVVPSKRFGLKPRLFVACALVVIAATAFFWFRQSAGKSDGDDQPLKLIAILPFTTVGELSEGELLGFGMADTLVIKMTNLRGLSVLPSGSVYKYTVRDKTVVDIGRELGVDAVLDGTVQRSGELVRVSAQLIRVRDGTTLWAAKFDQKFDNIFELHEQVGEQLANVLAQHLTSNDHARLSRRYTKTVEAYEAYVTGLYFWNKRGKAAVTNAINYFNRAIEKDPQYAPAYAMLADCYFLNLVDGYAIVSFDEARAKHSEYARKAIELDETLPEAHMVMAAVKEREGDYHSTELEYRRVFDLNPSFAIAHLRYSYFLLQSLDLEKAVTHLRMARQLDPVSPTTNAALCYMLTLSRQPDEAIRHCQRAQELDPEVINGRLNLGEAYLEKGLYNEARAEFQKLPKEHELTAMQAIAYTEARAGNRSAARDILSQLQSSVQADRIPRYNLALIFTVLGDRDRAFAELDTLRLTRFTIAMLKFDPQLDPLRSDPRFASYVRSRNLEHLIGDK